ncbi:MAG TPA: TetR family transcriptional regulator [Pseudonocardiaceae bacterium]|jgi:DNA-binding transcriptional regulator YbjK
MPIRPPTHRARGLARRETLLRAACTVLIEQGIEGATHRRIAEAAGMPLSTTSYFFSSLDELLAEAIRLTFAEVIEDTNAAILAMHRANPSTEQLVEQITDFILRSPQAGIVAQFEAYLAVDRRPELRAAIANVLDSYENAIGTALRLFDIDPSPHRVRLILAMFDGFAIQRIARPRQDDREILRAALHELLVGFGA